MKKLNVVLVVAATLISGVAAASDATDAIAAIGTEAGAIGSAAWPVVIAVTTVFVGMRLFKKFTGRF